MVIFTSSIPRRSNPEIVRIAAVLHQSEKWKTNEAAKTRAAFLGGANNRITGVSEHLLVEADIGNNDLKPTSY